MIINHQSHFQYRFGNLLFILLQNIKLFVTLIVVIYMILKELLSQYEIENNLNHKEMAQLLNISTSTYYRWLSGESTKLKKNNY
jgi:predicted transcriptional regulator